MTERNEFGRFIESKDGLTAERTRAYHLRYNLAHRDKINETSKKHHFRRRYGITQEKALELIEKAGNRCQICGSEFSSKNKPHIDHNHKTDAIRGVLCRNCNSGIGLLQDDPVLFEKAIQYLK